MKTKTKKRPKKSVYSPAFRAKITATQAEIAAAFRFVLPAADSESSRYAMNCVQLTFDEKGRPVLTATDGRRAHVATLSEPAEIVGDAPAFRAPYAPVQRAHCLVPLAVARELAAMPKAAGNWKTGGQMTLRVNNGGLSGTYYRGRQGNVPVNVATRYTTGRYPRVHESTDLVDSHNAAGTITGAAYVVRDWLNPAPRIEFVVDGERCAASHPFPHPCRSIKSEGTIADQFDATFVRDALTEMVGEIRLVSMGAERPLFAIGFGDAERYGSRERPRLELRAVMMPLSRDRKRG